MNAPKLIGLSRPSTGDDVAPTSTYPRTEALLLHFACCQSVPNGIVDDVMWKTVRIRSTASSIYGLHWLVRSNPRLCERIEAIEYHLTPSPSTGAPGSDVLNPLRFLDNRDWFDRDTFEMAI